MTAGDTLVFASAVDPIEPWRAALGPLLPDLAIRTPAETGPDDVVRYALVWKPAAGFFRRYPDLQLITILGAGADALADRDDLPDVPITRLSDPAMARMMTSYVLFATLRYARDIPAFEQAQRERRWAYIHPRPLGTTRVGVLGLGELGSAAAVELARQGFEVRGWARTPKQLDGVATSYGPEGLETVLAASDILVVMLPLTAATRNLLDARRFALMSLGAKLINVSRGAVVDEPALIDALTSGRLGGATLDVFATEPLPGDHALWGLPNVLVTPHLASVAIPSSAAPQVAENIRRVRTGRPVLHGVDLERGY